MVSQLKLSSESLKITLTTVIALVFLPCLIMAQGTIFGTVTNVDLSVPENGQISFYGYINEVNTELRVESCTGAGYDSGNWYDDFQNYLSEAPGIPYSYHFYNIANNESFHLSDLIPNNSFQQKNVSLVSQDFMSPPNVISSSVLSLSPAGVKIRWASGGYDNVQLFRREASSNGSFFRIDDPSGSLTSGITDTFYIDGDIVDTGAYDYLLLGYSTGSFASPHSEIYTIDITGDYFIPGDANADGLVNIGDCVYTISFIFREGASPMPYEAGDANCDGLVNVGDVVYTIGYIFREGDPPCIP